MSFDMFVILVGSFALLYGAFRVHRAVYPGHVLVLMTAYARVIDTDAASDYLLTAPNNARRALASRVAFFSVGRYVCHGLIIGSVALAYFTTTPLPLVVGAVGLYALAHYSVTPHTTMAIVERVALAYVEDQCSQIERELALLVDRVTTNADRMTDADQQVALDIRIALQARLRSEQETAEQIRSMMQRR